MSKQFSVTKCPYCGETTVEVKQYVKGEGTYFVDLKTGEVNTESIHDGLEYTNKNKYAVCTNCGKRVIKVSEIEGGVI